MDVLNFAIPMFCTDDLHWRREMLGHPSAYMMDTYIDPFRTCVKSIVFVFDTFITQFSPNRRSVALPQHRNFLLARDYDSILDHRHHQNAAYLG